MRKMNPAIVMVVGLLLGSMATLVVKFMTMNADMIANAVVWYCGAPAEDRAEMRSRVNALLADRGISAQIDCPTRVPK